MHSQTNTLTLEIIVSSKVKNNVEHKKEELRCTRAARVACGWWLDVVVTLVHSGVLTKRRVTFTLASLLCANRRQ
jgi:hypothetical protein